MDGSQQTTIDHPHPHEHTHPHEHPHPHPHPHPPAPGSLVRSPHLALTWSGDRLTLTDGLTGHVFAVSLPTVQALDLAGQPAPPDELADRAGIDRSVVDALAAARLLVEPGDLPMPDYWSTPELIVQRMAGGGGARADVDLDTMPQMRRGSWSGSVVALPAGAGAPRLGLDSVLAARRSRRDLNGGELDLASLASVLAGAARVQRASLEDGVSFRPHASGGGRHPLEITVVASRVRGLERGAYWFDAFDATLHEQDVDLAMLADLAAELGGSMGLDHPCEPPATLLITAVFARTMWKYDGIGLGLVYRDAGCLLQTLHLVAAALGLPASPAQLRREMDFARWLGHDPHQESLVGCFALGAPPAPRDV
jgi:SagB-type dehydrogenase family enzyme